MTVWNIAIHKDYRRQKIGTKILEYIFNFAESHNCDFISLFAETSNKAAQSFYDSLGYNKEVGYVKLINKDKW